MIAGSVDGAFRASVERHPSRVFLRQATGSDHFEETTYQDAAIRVAGTVLQLRELGVERGEVIASYVDDLTDSLYFWLACFHAGVIPLPVAPAYSIAMMRGIAERVDARFYFSALADAPRLNEERIRPLCFVAGKPNEEASIQALDTRPQISFSEAMTILDRAGAANSGSTPLFITPTSGSTGESKLPLWNHQSLQGSAEDLLLAFAITGDDPPEERFLLATSLTHGLGMTQAFAAPCIGATICVARAFDVAMSLEDARGLDFSVAFLTPRVLRSLHRQWLTSRKSDDERLFGPRARIIATAGAPPDQELMEFLGHQDITGLDIWGASEAGLMAYRQPAAQRERATSRPFPKNEIKVLDGELVARTHHMMVGYHRDERSTRDAFTADGFYRTGDAGEILPDGSVRLTGRKKDVFNTSEGANIYPGRLESAIEAFSWVRQAFLVGDRLPYLAAIIVVADVDVAAPQSPDGFLDAEEHGGLYARARAELAAFNERLEFVEKIRRFALLARPFPETMHQVVTIGKVRRSRPEFIQGHQARIDWLYSSSVPSAHLAVRG
jgi:long-chain acyl-CoA synthetase